MPDFKKIIKDNRNKQALHVLLLMQTHGLSKADATIVAYVDGPDGCDIPQWVPSPRPKPEIVK